MATTNVPGGGLEVTAGDGVDTAIFLQPGNWVATNTGSNSCVLNFDAAPAPTRSQPVGAGGAFLATGKSVVVPRNCTSLTYQDAVGGSTTSLMFSRNAGA